MQSVVEGLSAISGRGACTDAERRAALWLHDELRSRGHEAWVETRWVRPQRYATVALGCLLAVAGGLVATVAPAAGLAVAVIGALVLALEAAGFVPPLFPRRATQDVLVPHEGAAMPLVVAAAYDAPKDRWRRLLRPRWAWTACAVAVAGAAGARLGGVDATWLGAVQLVPTVVLLVAFAAAVDIALSGFAADSGSGAAVAVALFDELRREPPRSLAPSLLLFGAGRAARRPRAEGVVLELGPCGDGPPTWSAGHPQLRAAAGRAAEALGYEGGGSAAGVRIAGSAPEAARELALGVVDALDADLSAAAPAASRPA
jgi:hypothetical protein